MTPTKVECFPQARSRLVTSDGAGLLFGVTDMNLAELVEIAGPQVCFTNWDDVKAGNYDTRTNYKFEHGLVPKAGERPRALFLERRVYDPAQWRGQQEQFEARCEELEHDPERLQRLREYVRALRVSRLPNDMIEVISRTINLFQPDQMRPGNFRPRTTAIIKYANIFWRNAQKSSYIKKNLDPQHYDAKWFTKDISKRDFDLEPFGFFTESRLHEHLNQRAIYGIKANSKKPQHWYAADIDLHIAKGGNPQIFLKQIEAVLRFCQGQGWLVCLSRDQVDGIHLMKILDKPGSLGEAHSKVKAMLNRVADLNPELENEAALAGMKPIRQAEIFPDTSRGFRLPLGIGYTVLTDKVLPLVKYLTRNGVDLMGADVEGLMNWTGTEMSVDEKLAYIRQRVPASPGEVIKLDADTRISLKQEDTAQKAAKQDNLKVLGTMKGRYRQVLVDFYSGRMQVPKGLQTGILLGANALWAFDYPYVDRAEYLLSLLQGIKITNPNFSSRMNEGRWDEILDDIQHVVDMTEGLRADPSSDPKLQRSNIILKNWANAMLNLGFNFGDPTTWNTCLDGTEGRNNINFTFTDLEMRLITNDIAPVFVCPADTAVEAVIKMVKLAAIKSRQGNGMSREYRRAVLTDLGINVQENSKLARCWEVVEQAGFIKLSQKGVFKADGSGKGKANLYVVGSRVRDRVYPNREKTVLPEWLQGIEWMAEPCRDQPDTQAPDPEWAEWARRLGVCHTHTPS